MSPQQIFGVESKSMDTPDETHSPDKIVVSVVHLREVTVERLRAEPGFRPVQSGCPTGLPPMATNRPLGVKIYQAVSPGVGRRSSLAQPPGTAASRRRRTTVAMGSENLT
jgi:hypothetical protein